MPATVSAKTLALLILLGLALWFGAALMLRAIGPLGGTGIALLYALVVPGTWPFVMLGRWLADGATLFAVAVATATASLCDGVALAVVPRLYGADTAASLGAGAAILWGVGVALVLGIAVDRRR